MVSLPDIRLPTTEKRSLTVARPPDASAASSTSSDSDRPVIVIVSVPETTEIPVTVPVRLALTRLPVRLKVPPIVTVAEPIFTTSDVNVPVKFPANGKVAGILMLPLNVSEKPGDPRVAEVISSLPPLKVPVHLTTSPVPSGGFLKLNTLIIGDVSNPEPPNVSFPPEKKSMTSTVGVATTGGRKNRLLSNSVNI